METFTETCTENVCLKLEQENVVQLVSGRATALNVPIDTDFYSFVNCICPSFSRPSSRPPFLPSFPVQQAHKDMFVAIHAGIKYTESKSGRPAIFFRDPDDNCLEAVEINQWR
jgi:hypothetical protein